MSATAQPNTNSRANVGTIVSIGNGIVWNIRTGTSSQCSIIGKINEREAINYNCYVVDSIGRTWTYLHTSSSEYGWVLDETLPDGGSHVYCY